MDFMDISNTQLTTQNISQMEMDDMEMDFYDPEEAQDQVAPLGGHLGTQNGTGTMMVTGTQTVLGTPMDTVTQDTQLRTQSPFDRVSAPTVPLPDFVPSSRHRYINGHSLRHVSGANLGSGSFGNVTVGVLSDGSGRSKQVAIKHAQSMSKSEACKALKKEITVFEKIPSHQNIVEYIGGRVGSPGEDMANGNDFFIVEELLPGNLSDLIHSDTVFSQRCTYRHLITIFHGIVSGLSHLHAHNVIHHDLKPANVLISKDLVPKLADFGASTIRLRKSITATMRGTPGYIAPEAYYGGLVKQVSGGKVRVNESIDIFSLGAMMWECIVRQNIGVADNSQPTQDFDGKESLGTDDEPCIQWGGLAKVKCNCPKPLRDLVEACLRFDHDSIATMDFKRPTCYEICSGLQAMLGQDWIMGRPPWQL